MGYYKKGKCDKCGKEDQQLIGVRDDDFEPILKENIKRYVCKDCIRG